jgi:Radical SAM superfamily
MLESIAAPERLNALKDVFTLGAPIIHGGSFDGSEPCRVKTPAEPWAYAISWRPSLRLQSRSDNVLIAIRARAIQGRFGVLVMSGETVFKQLPFDVVEGLQTKLVAIPYLDQTTELIIRNYDITGVSIGEIEQIDVYENFDGRYKDDPDYDLSEITKQTLDTKLHRRKPFVFGTFTTTEICDLSCVMCHFNGPKAVKEGRTLSPEAVERALDQIPAGEKVWFAANGEFFVDPHAFDHLRAAVARGLIVGVLSHGQFYDAKFLDELLNIGVHVFRMSADSIDPVQFRKIRRGGELSKIVDACAYLQSKKREFPHISVEVTCTLLSNTFGKQKEFETFWSDKVDRLWFNAEYYDKFKYRNILHQPKRRVNCEIKTYVVPSGHIAPCCAIIVNQHAGAKDWLPHIDTHTLEEAYTILSDMYEDPKSPLSEVCRKCEWWIMWAQNERDVGSAYCRWIDFTKSDEPSTRADPDSMG